MKDKPVKVALTYLIRDSPRDFCCLLGGREGVGKRGFWAVCL